MKFNKLTKSFEIVGKTSASILILASFSQLAYAQQAMAQPSSAQTAQAPANAASANTAPAAPKIGNVGPNAANNSATPSTAGINYQTPSQLANPVNGAPVQGLNPTTTIGSPLNGITPPTANVGQGMMSPTGQVIPMAIPAPSSMPYNPSAIGAMSNDPNARLMELMNNDPATIRKMLKEIESRQRAAKEVSNSKATQNSVSVYITPGSSVPVLRTFANRASSLVIHDMSGKPWPIENFSLGGAEDFVVHRLDKNAKERGYMLDVTPTENYVAGNLTLKLEGLDVPVVLEIISGQKEYDAPLTVRVMAKGPNTTYSSVSAPEKTDPILYSILQGVPTDGLKPLRISSGLAQAWLAQDGKTMYVRSNLDIMVFSHKTSSPDGTYAYKTTKMDVLSYKYQNKFGQIIVEGF